MYPQRRSDYDGVVTYPPALSIAARLALEFSRHPFDVALRLRPNYFVSSQLEVQHW